MGVGLGRLRVPRIRTVARWGSIVGSANLSNIPSFKGVPETKNLLMVRIWYVCLFVRVSGKVTKGRACGLGKSTRITGHAQAKRAKGPVTCTCMYKA